MIHLKQRRVGSSEEGGKCGVEVKHVANTGLHFPGRRAMVVGDMGRMSFKRKQTSEDTIREIEFGFICFVCKNKIVWKTETLPLKNARVIYVASSHQLHSVSSEWNCLPLSYSSLCIACLHRNDSLE